MYEFTAHHLLYISYKKVPFRGHFDSYTNINDAIICIDRINFPVFFKHKFQ